MTCLEEPHVVVKEEYRQRDRTWGACLFLGPMGGVSEGSWAKAGLVSSYPKSKVSVSRTGVLSKWCTRHVDPRRQDYVARRAVGESYQDFDMFLPLWLLSRAYTCTGG